VYDTPRVIQTPVTDASRELLMKDQVDQKFDLTVL